MTISDLVEKFREGGYKLELTEDWQKVLVSGDLTPPAPLRRQLHDDREQVRAL